jgi:hypothetical protein
MFENCGKIVKIMLGKCGEMIMVMLGKCGGKAYAATFDGRPS